MFLSVVLLAAAMCPQTKIQVERLPDLNMPRACHHTLCVNGEPLVIGGHTTGFKPTATAEFYHDGKWHTVNTLYTHDDGFALPLSLGRVMVVGGYEKDFGIGQVYSAELYDPATHTCEPLNILDTKRAEPSALEIDSGRVVVSGNWYHDDDIELLGTNHFFAKVKEVSQQRAFPFMFRTAKDNAVIFGSRATHMDEQHDTVIVDRLHGEPFTPALFRQWKPMFVYNHSSSPDVSRIADYSYLFPVADSTGQVAIAQLQGEDFTLLPTDYPVPMKNKCWFAPVIVDRQNHRAYLMGADTRLDSIHVYYVLAIDYQQSPARLTLYDAECDPDVGLSIPVLTPDGNLMMAGGLQNGNFKPFSSVVLFRTGPHEYSSLLPASFFWWWVVGGLLLAALAFTAVILVLRYRRRSNVSVPYQPNSTEVDDAAFDDLMQRICELMENERVYLDSGLKLSDVADRLGVRSRQVSDCIKVKRNCLFAQFVNTYRVEFAKQLLCNYPNLKMAAVWTGAGFSHESTFFRTFKAVVGMTPKEWMAKKD